MKRLLLISALLLFVASTNGWAQVSDEIHQRCKDAADYVGCVQVFTGSVPTAAKSNKEQQLIDALYILPDRIAETSLNSLSENTRPFSDALALASADKTLSESRLVNDAKKIKDAINFLYNVWDASIRFDYKNYMPCEGAITTGANTAIRFFNFTLGGTVLYEQNPDNSREYFNWLNCDVVHGSMAVAIGWTAEKLAREGKLDLPPLLPVTQIREEDEAIEKTRKAELEAKPTLSSRQIIKKEKRARKIMQSDMKNDSKFRQEAEELYKEIITSIHQSGELELQWKNNARYGLANIYFIEKKYDEAKKHLGIIIKSNVYNDCRACYNNKTLREAFINRISLAQEMLVKIESEQSQ